MLVIVGIIVFFMCYLLTGIYRKYALNKLVLDIPNQRSSHLFPTPRGGGLAIVVATLFGALVAGQWLEVLPHLIAYLVPSLIIAGVSYWDDLGHVKARWRLLAQFIAVFSAYWLIGQPISLNIESFPLSLYLPLNFLSVIFAVWLINLYNFMDGINGIAALTASAVAIALVALLFSVDAPLHLFIVPLMLLGANLGFLIWNFPVAKIFMGDIGSCFIGLIMAILFWQLGAWNPLFYIILPIILATFLVDASLTVFLRLLRRQKIYHAHREHAYQHLVRRWGSHTRVTFVYTAIVLFYLLPIAWLLLANFISVWAGLFLAYLPLTVLAFIAGAGRSEHEIRVSTCES